MNNNQSEKSTLPNYRWIKFEIDYFNDPDFMQLSSGAVGAYLKLYLLAGKADAGGLLCNSNKVFSSRDLSWFLRCSTEEMTMHLEELSRAGFITEEDGGYKVSRFIDEQGPGDNAKRQSWRDRQSKHRARAKGEEELEKEIEPEGEGEVEREIERHGDVTVTQETPLPLRAITRAPVDFQHSEESLTDEEKLDNRWKAVMGNKLGHLWVSDFLLTMDDQEDVEDKWERLDDCLCIWVAVVENHREDGWHKYNPRAVMELFPIPSLEHRMQREGLVWSSPEKELERLHALWDYGYIDYELIEEYMEGQEGG